MQRGVFMTPLHTVSSANQIFSRCRFECYLNKAFPKHFWKVFLPVMFMNDFIPRVPLWRQLALRLMLVYMGDLSASPTPSRVDLQQEAWACIPAFFPQGTWSLWSISRGGLAAAIRLHNKWFWLGASVNVCTHRTVFGVKEWAQGPDIKHKPTLAGLGM